MRRYQSGYRHAWRYPDIFAVLFLARKALAHFRGNLVIAEFVSGFNGENVSFEAFVLDPFFQLAFGFPRPKYLDGIGIPYIRNNLIVKFGEIISKFSVPLIFRCDFL